MPPYKFVVSAPVSDHIASNNGISIVPAIVELWHRVKPFENTVLSRTFEPKGQALARWGL